MQIAVISDLHLGPGGASDCFGHEDSEFEIFLRRLEADFERIILLGDIWETLTTSRLYCPKEGLRASRSAHPRLAQRFERPRYWYVHGNHDWIAESESRALSELVVDCNGQRLLFTHGHHHDWLIRQARWLSECGVWLGGWLHRLRLSRLYQLACSLEAWLTRPAMGDGLDSFQRWALGLARLRSADVVVTGHTHVAQRKQRDGRVYLNSGSCSRGAFSYLAIDTANEQYLTLTA